MCAVFVARVRYSRILASRPTRRAVYDCFASVTFAMPGIVTASGLEGLPSLSSVSDRLATALRRLAVIEQ